MNYKIQGILPSTVAEMKHQFLTNLANSTEFDSLFEHAVAMLVSSRRYELLTTGEVLILMMFVNY